MRVERDTGYRGIWYSNQPTGDKYVYKYSGGFATYPQQHVPVAIYVSAAHKTFFVYGGTSPGKNELQHMVSYLDHENDSVPRPAILLNKKTDDAHDNPTLAIDGDGHLWVFSNAHGTERPAFLHRSTKPFEIDEWERIEGPHLENFSYGQPWFVPGKGFVFLHTRYKNGRGLHVMASRDGRHWDTPTPIAHLAQGHYQVSWLDSRTGRVGDVFDYHPLAHDPERKQGGLNYRTNLYYIETADLGATWRTVEGKPLSLPLTDVRNPALIHDYEAEDRRVYIKDLTFDADGHPVILYLTAKSYRPGPDGAPRTLKTAHWTGKEWVRRPLTGDCDHAYDHGSLYIEGNLWRVIVPTDPGPQPGTTGGEMVLWESADAGRNWKRVRAMTANSARNHTYARRPLNAHLDFYALWADGNTLAPSESRLYFCDRAGNVFLLPESMKTTTSQPATVKG